MPYEAIELVNCDDVPTPRFYRMILHTTKSRNATIIVRYAKIGTPGVVRVEHLSPDAATIRFQALYRRARNRGYEEDHVDNSMSTNTVPDRLTAVQVEQAYLCRWYESKGLYYLPRPTDSQKWTLRTGLLLMSRRHFATAAALQAMLAGSHAVDYDRDLILVPESDRRNSPDAFELYPYNPRHTKELLDTVLSLYYKGHPDPRALFPAAELLLAAR